MKQMSMDFVREFTTGVQLSLCDCQIINVSCATAQLCSHNRPLFRTFTTGDWTCKLQIKNFFGFEAWQTANLCLIYMSLNIILLAVIPLSYISRTDIQILALRWPLALSWYGLQDKSDIVTIVFIKEEEKVKGSDFQ